MVRAIVEHYLSDAGRASFPAWVQHVDSLLALREDALGCQQVRGIDVARKEHDDRRCLVEVRFRTLDGLRRWVATDEHHAILAALEPYVERPRTTLIYEARHEGAGDAIRTESP